MQDAKKVKSIYILRRMSLPLLIIILIIAASLLVPAVAARPSPSPTSPPSSSSSPVVVHYGKSTGGVGDVIMSKGTSLNIFDVMAGQPAAQKFDLGPFNSVSILINGGDGGNDLFRIFTTATEFDKEKASRINLQRPDDYSEMKESFLESEKRLMGAIKDAIGIDGNNLDNLSEEDAQKFDAFAGNVAQFAAYGKLNDGESVEDFCSRMGITGDQFKECVDAAQSTMGAAFACGARNAIDTAEEDFISAKNEPRPDTGE